MKTLLITTLLVALLQADFFHSNKETNNNMPNIHFDAFDVSSPVNTTQFAKLYKAYNKQAPKIIEKTKKDLKNSLNLLKEK